MLGCLDGYISSHCFKLKTSCALEVYPQMKA
jgi:hypothetical protein